MTGTTAHYYLISYDVTDDKSRAHIARKLQAYGDRIQFSAFLVSVSPARFIRLKATLIKQIDCKEDSVILCDLGPTSSVIENKKITYLGCTRQVIPLGAVIM